MANSQFPFFLDFLVPPNTADYYLFLKYLSCDFHELQVALVVKNLPANAGGTRDSSSIPGWGRTPGGGNGNPFLYPCRENLKDRGAWRAKVYEVTKSQTQLSTQHTLDFRNVAFLVFDPISASSPLPLFLDRPHIPKLLREVSGLNVGDPPIHQDNQTIPIKFQNISHKQFYRKLEPQCMNRF